MVITPNWVIGVSGNAIVAICFKPCAWADPAKASVATVAVNRDIERSDICTSMAFFTNDASSAPQAKAPNFSDQ
jgi:hypothetical protein